MNEPGDRPAASEYGPHLPPGEVALATFQPARRSILLRSARAIAWGAGIIAAGAIAGTWVTTQLASLTGLSLDVGALVTWVGAGLILARVGWEVLVRLSRRYTLTPRRLIATRGVIARTTVDIPLERVQQVVLDRTVGERILGLGTVAVTSAGSQTIDLAWVMVGEARARFDAVRAALTDAALPVREVAGGSGRDGSCRLVRESVASERHAGGRILVVGLVGGIGSGKSEVARAFAQRGWLVIDSDKEAKAALDRPEVRRELVGWWGAGILREDGTVDRKAVADVVFRDPEQRRRLEGLVHPLVRARRGALIERAASEGTPGVVIDAPLLLEAGSDVECDFVIFVACPRETRLERVRATRGWSEEELDRREAAQIPLEAKIAASDDTVVNDSEPAVLRGRVAELIRRLSGRPSARRGRRVAWPPPGAGDGTGPRSQST